MENPCYFIYSIESFVDKYDCSLCISASESLAVNGSGDDTSHNKSVTIRPQCSVQARGEVDVTCV